MPTIHFAGAFAVSFREGNCQLTEIRDSARVELKDEARMTCWIKHEQSNGMKPEYFVINILLQGEMTMAHQRYIKYSTSVGFAGSFG